MHGVFKHYNREFNGPVRQTRVQLEAGDGKMDAHRPALISIKVRILPRTAFSQLPCISTMAEKSKRPKGRDGVLFSLNVAIDGLNIAKELSSITPATAVFGSVSILLTMIKVRFLLCCDEVS